MMRFLYKRWVRVCAIILCILSFQCLAGSFLVMMVGYAEGIYEKEEEQAWEDAKESLCSKYSVRAAAGFRDDFGQEYLSDTNFRYGVIQTDSIKGLNLNDRSIYEVCSFDRKVTRDMLYIHSYSLGDNTELCVSESLFDNYFVYNGEPGFQKEKKPIEECYYARDTGNFYCKAGDAVYPVTSYVELVNPLDSEGDKEAVFATEASADPIHGFDLMPQTAEDGHVYYVWQNDWQQIVIQGQTWYLADIAVITQKEVSRLGTVVSEDPEDADFQDFSVENGYLITYTQNIKNTVPYYILSYVNEPLTTKGDYFHQNLFGKMDGWQKQDFFVQSKSLIRLVYSLRYLSIGIMLVSGILFLVSLCALLIGAGHRDSSEVTAGWMEKIPFDIFLAVTFFLFFGMFLIEVYCVKVINSLKLSIWCGLLLTVLAELLALAFCMDAAVRIKLGRWWENTLCFRLCAGLFRCFRRSVNRVQRALPMVWKAWIFMALIAGLELFGLSVTAYHPDALLALWFVEKLMLYAFLTVCLLQMKKLKVAGEKLSAGELDSRIDTRRMFWDLKAHGENLNHIREGIHRAVAEQLKSERFQTELITNVSHDIKTPLTSIINYVDLLEKEEIPNETVQAYLEVLSRQSTRLKKLIEDLMEASKASAGSLSVAWENCDAQVMLTQTIGEFEEKLKANQIELIVKNSEEAVLILADPRHLWRIFDNLMNNICKYAQPSTRAYVNIEKKGEKGRIIFRNISKYALNIDSEELMKRFVRGDSSRNTEGNGLGLSIAKSLTELMKGEFELIIDGDLFKVMVTFPMIEDGGGLDMQSKKYNNKLQ